LSSLKTIHHWHVAVHQNQFVHMVFIFTETLFSFCNSYLYFLYSLLTIEGEIWLKKGWVNLFKKRLNSDNIENIIIYYQYWFLNANTLFWREILRWLVLVVFWLFCIFKNRLFFNIFFIFDQLRCYKAPLQLGLLLFSKHLRYLNCVICIIFWYQVMIFLFQIKIDST